MRIFAGVPRGWASKNSGVVDDDILANYWLLFETLRDNDSNDQATIMGSSLEDSPMTLGSSRLTSPQNSKGNMERGRRMREG